MRKVHQQGDLRTWGRWGAKGREQLNRCLQPIRAPEPKTCTVHKGHHAFLDNGYRDAMRTHNRTGPGGVVGVGRRIDFLYTTAEVETAWYDRCYQAWFALQPKCKPHARVFETNGQFLKFQRRSLHVGRPGDGCPPAQFHRYYSDHRFMLATVR